MRSATLFVISACLSLAAHDAAASEKVACVQAAEQGQDLRDAGKLLDARLTFERCARATCPRAVVAECANWLNEVTARVPSIVVHAQASSGGALSGAKLSVDGVDLGPVDAAPRAFDPGEHVVRVSDGARVVEARITLRDGQGETPLWVVLPEVVAVRPLPHPDVAPVLRSPRVAAPRVRKILWPAYALSGASIAAFGTFAFFGLEANHDFNQLRTSCGSRCTAAQIDPVHTKADVADASLGVGLAFLGAAAWAWLSPPRNTSTAASIAPMVGPGSAGIQGRF